MYILYVCIYIYICYTYTYIYIYVYVYISLAQRCPANMRTRIPAQGTEFLEWHCTIYLIISRLCWGYYLS